MKPHTIKTLVITAAMAVASIASADILVNVNFGATRLEAELVGPIGSTGETWNQAGTTKLGIDLSDSAGTATTIDWSLSGSFSNGDWNKDTTLEMLESTFWVQDSNVRTLTISGLNPASKYALYIASFDQNSWANTPMSFSTTNTTTTVGAQVASNTDGTTWTLNNNYVLFEGLEPNSSNEIAIDGVRVEGLYGMWCGFQLQETAGPPAGTVVVIK